MSKCIKCSRKNCGDDLHTRTTYAGPERAVGDRMKVILLQVYDMLERDNLQVYEILALFEALVREHIREMEE